MKDVVSHIGKVVSVSDTQVFVKIERNAACSDCKSKKICQIGDSKDEIISIRTAEANAYLPNEEVEVLICTSLGMKAALYAYILPLILLFAAFLTARQFTSSEIVQIFSAIIPVIAYYFILYKMRHRLEKTFQIYIKKILK